MKLDDLTVRNRMEVMCPLCQNTGKVMLTSEDDTQIWNHARPCPICKGVGQINKARVPTREEIAHAMMNYSFK